MASDVVAAVAPFVVPVPDVVTFDVTSAQLGGRTPKAAILVMTGHADSHEFATLHARIGIGFAVNGGNRAYAACRSRNDVASSAVRRVSRLHGSSTGCALIRPTVDALAPSVWPASTGWITNGVRLAYNLEPGTPPEYRGFVVMFAGEDLVAHAGTTPALGTEAGTVDITAPGFMPDLVFFASAADQGQLTPSLSNFFTLGFGVAVRGGGQMCSFLAEANGASGGKPSSILDTARAMLQLNSGGTTVQYRCLVEDWDEDGFSITTDAGTADDDFPYLALKLGDRRAAVWQTTAPATTGQAIDATPGWRPQLGVAGGLGLPSPAAVYDSNEAGGFSVGAFDEGGGQVVGSVRIAATGGANTATQSRCQPEALNAPRGDLWADRAELVAMLNNGWALDWTVASGNEPVYWAVALESMLPPSAAAAGRRAPPLRTRRLGLGVT